MKPPSELIPKLLGGTCRLFTTSCIQHELKKLGSDFLGTWVLAIVNCVWWLLVVYSMQNDHAYDIPLSRLHVHTHTPIHAHKHTHTPQRLVRQANSCSCTSVTIPPGHAPPVNASCPLLVCSFAPVLDASAHVLDVSDPVLDASITTHYCNKLSHTHTHHPKTHSAPIRLPLPLHTQDLTTATIFLWQPKTNT